MNAPLGMLENVVMEKPIPRAAGAPPSPSPVVTPSKVTPSPSAKETSPSPPKVESANERLRSIFRRQSTNDTKKAPPPSIDSTLLSPFPGREKEVLKGVAEQLEEVSTPPPPTPEKSGTEFTKRVASPPPMDPESVKEEDGGPRVSPAVEKELPTPEPDWVNGTTLHEELHDPIGTPSASIFKETNGVSANRSWDTPVDRNASAAMSELPTSDVASPNGDVPVKRPIAQGEEFGGSESS